MNNLREPYIKRQGSINQFNIWIVNGENIRKNIDEEFTNFGQHYRFKFIPKNEFWIDNPKTKGEERFFIDHMLVEHRLMKAGMKYSKAIEIADRIEKRERSKENKIKVEYKKEILKKIHKKILSKNKSLKIWVVDGKLVRDFLRIDFTEGGHDKVYSFIPKGEVWIDDDLQLKERKFIILHELNERMLMSLGADYETAHQNSSALEYFYRHNQKGINEKIKDILRDNKLHENNF